MLSTRIGLVRGLCSTILSLAVVVGLPESEVFGQEASTPGATTADAEAAPASPADLPAKPSAQAAAQQVNTNPTMRLGPGDVIEVGVYNVPELTTKARVDSDGNIYLPLIDYVHVAGLTIDQSQSIIEKRLNDGGFVKDPHVSIFVTDFAPQGASIMGEVNKPGVYPVLGQQRLFDLISAAGGLADHAGRKIIITHRDHPDQPSTIQLAQNIAESPDGNVRILPGDTVVVQKADIIFVVGDVGKPSGFLLDRGTLTVLQAVALAGGTNRTAKLTDAKIIRKGPDGMHETPVELKKILQAKAPDVNLQPDDILFVPSKSGFLYNTKVGMETAARLATTVTYTTVMATR